MGDVDPKKLKVADLKEELKKRGLDIKGIKPILTKRLEKALANEKGKEMNVSKDTFEDLNASAVDTDLDNTVEPVPPDTQIEVPAVEDDNSSDQPTVAVESEAVEKTPVAEKIPAEEESPAVQETPAPEEKLTEEEIPDENQTTTVPPAVNQTAVTAASEEIPAENNSDMSEIKEELADVTNTSTDVKEETNADDVVEKEPNDVKTDTEETGETTQEKMEQEPSEQKEEQTSEVKEEMDTQESNENKEDTDGQKIPNESIRYRSRSPHRSHDRHHSDEKRSRSKSPHGRKRSRSRSRSRSPRHDRYARSPRARSPQGPPEMEKDDWLEVTDVQLDRFNSDLQLTIDETGLKGTPATEDGFAFIWAGARSMWGVKKGKVGFQVKVVKNIPVEHLPPEETTKHVMRIGWSTTDTSLQLGEEKLSYGYGGTAKASADCKFKDYGETFDEGDVVTALVNFEGEQIVISFSKNEAEASTCFEIETSDLEDKALFPHVLTKNCEFECNFGQKEEPYFPLPEGFTFINDLEADDKIRGSLPPNEKSECEILMMCGIPGAGKTYWSLNHTKENPDKIYTVLGTNCLLDRMRVMGLPRKGNYAGRWDVLISLASKCLNKLLDLAARRKRNYILDQTNVYASAQRRKIRPFEGFQRKAIVVIPTEETLKERTESREKTEGKDVPETAVNEMKANFWLPEKGSIFDEVIFTELGLDEAKKMVDKYRNEGRAALPPEKQYRRDNRADFNRDQRRDYRSYDNRDTKRYSGGGNRGGYQERKDRNYRDGRRDRGSGGGSHRGGGYNHNRNDYRSGGRQNQGHQQGGYRQPAQNWGQQGWGQQNWSQGWGQQSPGYAGYSQGQGQSWGQQGYPAYGQQGYYSTGQQVWPQAFSQQGQTGGSWNQFSQQTGQGYGGQSGYNQNYQGGYK